MPVRRRRGSLASLPIAVSWAAVLATAPFAGCPASCPDGRYPEVPATGTVLYVDAELGTPGGSGSCQDPIDEIYNAAGTLIAGGTLAVAAGEYTGDVVTGASLSVLGVGADEVTVRGGRFGIQSTDAGALTVRGLTVAAAEIGVFAQGVGEVVLDDVALRDHLEFGAYLDGATVSVLDATIVDNGPAGPGRSSGGLYVVDGGARVERSELRRNAGAGLWAVDADLKVVGSTISDAVAGADGEIGRGVEVSVDVGPRPSLEIRGSTIERYADAAVLAAGVDAVVLDDVAIAVAERCDTPFGGVGVYLQGGDALAAELIDLSVTGACGTAVYAVDGGAGTLRLDGATLTGTAPGRDELGVALRVEGPTTQLQSSHLGESTGAALMARCAAVMISGSSVVDVQTASGEVGGDGLVVGDTLLTLADSLFDDVARCATRVVGDSALDAVDNVFGAGLADACFCDLAPEALWIEAFETANELSDVTDAVQVLDDGGSCPGPDPGGCE